MESVKPVKVEKSKKQTKKMSALAEDNATARAAGMSYGQYKGMLILQSIKGRHGKPERG